jgi:anti-sigma B factor antagonist
MGDDRERTAGDAWRAAFQTQIELRGDTLCVSLIGELDLAAAPQLDDLALAALLTDQGARVTIDLRHLTFLDASGLRALVSLKARLATVGAYVELLAGPPKIQRLFEITGLAEYFSFSTAGDPAAEPPHPP